MKYPIAIVDCNNFYASCERVFNPKLKGMPILILSNNDGIIVARSNEAKALGIKMGEPLFKVKDIVSKQGVHVFSSNYTLYGDMSQRVMTSLESLAPDVEVYSIDEAFLNMWGFESRDVTEYCRYIKNTIQKWTGIPVSIGIAGTKTLAKLANRIAKKNPKYNGVLNIINHPEIDEFLKMTEVADVWGIGRQYSKKLNSINIKTAYEFIQLRDKWIKQNMTVMGLRTAFELRGTPCIEIDTAPPPKKSIICSRSFGRQVVDKHDVMEAVANFASRAAEKMRHQNSTCTVLHVFLRTNPFKDTPQYHNGCMAQMPVPTDLTPELLFYARKAAEQVFKEGYIYNKVGVMLSGFFPSNYGQMSLFDTADRVKLSTLTTAVDKINDTFGPGTIYYAGCGIKRTWKTRRDSVSPSYTTEWEEIPNASAGGLNLEDGSVAI